MSGTKCQVNHVMRHLLRVNSEMTVVQQGNVLNSPQTRLKQSTRCTYNLLQLEDVEKEDHCKDV